MLTFNKNCLVDLRCWINHQTTQTANLTINANETWRAPHFATRILKIDFKLKLSNKLALYSFVPANLPITSPNNSMQRQAGPRQIPGQRGLDDRHNSPAVAPRMRSSA